jgi:chemotaxis protein histidine kinase CheA
MILPHPPRGVPPASGASSERLLRLRDQFQATAGDPTAGLAAIRAELESLRREAEGTTLADALERLLLVTEVWECLADERPESAGEAATFLIGACGRLAANPEDTSGILRESSACWSDYLGLIDPPDADIPDDSEEPPAESPDDVDEPAPSSIDAVTLLRLLTGREPGPEPAPRAVAARPHVPERTEPSPGPAGAPPATTVARVERCHAGGAGVAPAASPEIDPECREAFISEALDLFERIQSLVVSLGGGDDPQGTLTELSRCFHTLKGAAGSVGLIELASRIHCLEQGLEEASGQLTAELLNQLHEALGHLEAVLDSLRQGGSPAPVPGPGPGSEPVRPPAAMQGIEDDRPAGDEPADGPVRVPAGKMDELMDLASELIVRRTAWAAQAERLKASAGMIRNCRNELQVRLDRLDELGFTRAPGPGARRLLKEDGRGGAGVDPSSDAGTAVLRLAEQVEDLVVLAEAVQKQAIPLAEDSETLARLTLHLWEALQSIRIVPVRGLFQRLARVAHDAARTEGRAVEVERIGEDTGLDRAVQDKAFEPLLHIVRNAVGHGIESPEDRMAAGKAATGRVTLEARREGNTLVLSVHDDGRGLDYAAIAEKGRRLGLLGADEAATTEWLSSLIFRPGFSTRQEANTIAGRGVGMDVVAQEVRRLRGTIELESRPGTGTRIILRLPARLALEQAMVARIAGQAVAIPISLIEHAQSFEPGDVEGEGPDATVRVRDRPVPLIAVREALGFPAAAAASCPKLLLVRVDGEALALLLDAIEGTREVVIKSLGPLLAGHPVLWGTSLSLTGDVILVLNPSGLLRRLREGRADETAPEHPRGPRPAPVLVVDDSISVRRVVTRQLRMLGLEVEEVSDGVEALGRLSSRPYSMVLTDLEMPRMDGFELLAELRRSPALAALPVVVASTEGRLATRRRVLALGARAFVAKPIDQDELARVAGALLNGAVGLP